MQLHAIVKASSLLTVEVRVSAGVIVCESGKNGHARDTHIYHTCA